MTFSQSQYRNINATETAHTINASQASSDFLALFNTYSPCNPCQIQRHGRYEIRLANNLHKECQQDAKLQYKRDLLGGKTIHIVGNLIEISLHNWWLFNLCVTPVLEPLKKNRFGFKLLSFITSLFYCGTHCVPQCTQVNSSSIIALFL